MTRPYRLLIFTALVLPSYCNSTANASSLMPTSISEMAANKMNGTDVNAAGERIMSPRALRQDCPGENYYPCTCANSGYGFEVSCRNVPYVQVKAVLSQSITRTLYKLEISLFDPVVPENVTGGVSTQSLAIVGRRLEGVFFTCSPQAFTSTEATTEIFHFSGWDLSEHDFTYLKNFIRLRSILIVSCNGFFYSWHTLPPLPNWQTLLVQSCNNIGYIDKFPPQQRLLKEVKFLDDLLDDASAASILDWLLLFSSNRAERIGFLTNLLTTIPSQLSSFSRLTAVYMNNNIFSHLPAGSFNFHPSAPIQFVDLTSCKVETIEPGAFSGDFGNVMIWLNGNRLSRFEEAVFKEILQQMAVRGNTGYVDLTSNPIDCDADICHLEWLIVTNPKLLAPLRNGQCSNGTVFQKLDATAIRRACSKEESTSTEATTQLSTSSIITAAVTTPQMTEETASATTGTKMTTGPSYVTPFYSTIWSTMTTKEAHENGTSHITSTMTNENVTSISDQATTYTSQKPSASSIAQHSTGLLLVPWMLIVAGAK